MKTKSKKDCMVKPHKDCVVVKLVDACSVGNRDKKKSKVVKRGMTREEADKYVEKMNRLSRWMYPFTSFYVLSKTEYIEIKKAA